MRKLLLLTWMMLSFFQFAFAQQREVTGQVTDARDGSPIAGATVKERGGKAATITNSSGNFTLTVSPKAKALVVSSVGYADNEVAISGSTVNVAMAQATESLDEVVVIGYGTKIKRDVIGSVVKVSSKEINNTPATSFESAIQGRASGVFVQQQNGKLGQGINIRIRGASSVTAGNEPLYVIDGIPVVSGNSGDLSGNGAATNALADINMNDIESIDILKDASATAIYGSQASNGVVLITTKKGRAGTSTINFGYYTGFQKPTRKREFLNAQQYVDFFTQAALGAAKQDVIYGYYNNLEDAQADELDYVQSRFTRYAAGQDTWKTGSVNTNWQDQAFQNAPISQYDLNVAGGNDKTKFYLSGQYLDQDGIIIRNAYKRYSGRANIDHKVKDWLTVGMNLSFARSKNFRVSNDNSFATPIQMVALSPITPVIDPRTGLVSGALDPATGAPNTNYPVYFNPLLYIGNAFYQTTVNRTIGNVYANVQIAPSLIFRTEFGIDQLNQVEEDYYGKLTARNLGVPNGFGSYGTVQSLYYTTNNYFNFSKTFNGLHNVDAVAGMAYQDRTRDDSYAEGQEFPSDAYKKLSSAAQKTNATSSSTSSTLLSYFARVNYKYNDRYLLGVSGRIDGSSRFGANNKYGFFPAVSAGWILSEEEFMKNIKVFSFLKLKGSYGLTGNDNIPDFASRNLFSGNGSYGGNAGQRPSQLGNPDLKWESTAGTDLGLEGGFFANRLTFEIDVYQRKTKDLILQVEVPGTSGFSTQYQNIGSLSNKGFEISVNSTNILTKNFRWTTSANFSLNRNKITNLGGQIIGSDVNKAKEGEPLGVFYGREYAGVDPENGDALYYLNTTKADGTLDRSTTNDYNAAADVKIGDPNPDFFYGMQNTFTYKTFDLDVLLQGVYGNQIFNGGGGFMSASGSNGFDNQTIDQLRAWKKPGDITDVPEARLFYPNGIGNSNRYISTGSYLRVKAVTLGYNLPKSITSRLKISSLRVYARAQNLFTFTKYTGWDPEVTADYLASNIIQGYDFYSAPQIKAIVFGVNLSL